MSKPSKMADVAAAVRAVHVLHEDAIIFNDPFAIHLTSRGWRILAKSRLFYKIGVRKMLNALRPMQGQVLARSRYTEEKLESAIKAGLHQYVILGAGLDSFSLRYNDPAENLTIFEIDHPATQKIKQKRLSRIAAITKHPIFIGVNFEKENIQQAMQSFGFDAGEPAFISWLGTTPYLTKEAFLKTINSLAGMSSGTELVFDYADALISQEESNTVEKLKAFTKRRGEELVTQFSPDELKVILEKKGFEVLEDISQGNWRTHYYQDTQLTSMQPLKAARIIHARKK